MWFLELEYLEHDHLGLSKQQGKVEEILDEGPGYVKEPFLIVFQSDRLTERDTSDHGLWRIGFFTGLTGDPVKRI